MPSIHQTTLLLLTTLTSTNAMPLIRREMTTGAKAGMGVGIAVAAIVVVAVAIFLFMHLRRSAHIRKINQERAILAGEKNADGSDKEDKFAPTKPEQQQQQQPQVSAIPRRNKSVKDRLMGPLYRGSVIDLHPMPARAKIPGENNRSNRQSTMTVGEGDEAFLNKPWAKDGESSPRPSFSSKRATRMMMMM